MRTLITREKNLKKFPRWHTFLMQVKVCLGCVYLTKLMFSKKKKNKEKGKKTVWHVWFSRVFTLETLLQPQKRFLSPPSIKPGNLSHIRQMSKPEVLSLCVWTFVWIFCFCSPICLVFVLVKTTKKTHLKLHLIPFYLFHLFRHC